MSTLRIIQCVVISSVLAHAPLSAQGGYRPTGGSPPPVIPPVRVLEGGSGPDVLVGWDHYDNINDRAVGPDVDKLYDSPGVADGKPDRLDSQDGDPFDRMHGGVEDTYVGDPQDLIVIFSQLSPNGTKKCLWEGTVEEYERTRALIRWTQDLLHELFVQGGAGGGTLGEVAMLLEVQAALGSAAPGSSPIQFSQQFPLGPYVIEEAPGVAAGYLRWLPFPDLETLGDPAQQTSTLEMTPDEYDAAVTGALGLIQHALELVQSSDGG